MEYQNVIEQARGCIGPYCKACAVCDGRACKNTMPGPGAKGIGDVAIRNFQKWQEIRINMDTICEKRPVDTAVWTGICLSVFCRTGRGSQAALWRKIYRSAIQRSVVEWMQRRRDCGVYGGWHRSQGHARGHSGSEKAGGIWDSYGQTMGYGYDP